MKKMLARFGLLGFVAGLAGMSYAMPAVAAATSSSQDQNVYYEYEIIIGPGEYYLIYEYGVAAPGDTASAAALSDSSF